MVEMQEQDAAQIHSKSSGPTQQHRTRVQGPLHNLTYPFDVEVFSVSSGFVYLMMMEQA